MAFADWFKRGSPPPRPSDLRESLLSLLARKDTTGLMSLINDNSEAIRTAFPSWINVPEAIRGQPAQLELYSRMMLMLATVFERAGDASLMVRLKGDDPFARWDAALKNTQKLADEGRADDAVALARSVLTELNGMTGSGVDHCRPRALGSLGVALAKAGKRDEAIVVTREALDLCRQAGDEEGVRVYTSSLKVLGTYQLSGDEGGKRPTVSLQDDRGLTLLPEELAQASGRITWEVRQGEPIPREAERLHSEGRAAGAAGDYQKAIALFTSAAELAPSWPYPVYDRAFTYLHLNDTAAALADYRQTLELSPRGFFTAALSEDMLTREIAGEYPDGLCTAFLSLETMTREQQGEILSQLVERFPSFSAAWSAYSDHQPDAQSRLAAIERGLAAPCDRDTHCVLLVKKALALATLGERFRALAMLQPIVRDATGSIVAQAMASILLAQLEEPGSTAAASVG